jgi:hypothetical protein
MDSEWVSRAGIIAEAVSFILIAPEILGATRLASAQQAIGGILRKILRPSRIWADKRYVPMLPGLLLGDPDVDFLSRIASAVMRGTYFAVFIPAMATGLIRGRAMVAFLVASMVIVVSTLLETGAILLAQRKASTRTSKYLAYSMAIPAAPWSWAQGGLFATVFVALRLGARGGVALLSGPDRLRALVFGTGVVLLFGGLGAQFYATF